MKSWLRHFILGIIIGAISVVIIRVIQNSIPGYANDSNLLVALLLILAYGVGTTILGEILMVVGRKK